MTGSWGHSHGAYKVEFRKGTRRSVTPYSGLSAPYIFIGGCHPPAKIIEEVMEENDNNNSFSWTWSSCPVLNSCQSNPCCEGTTHARSGGKEKWPTTNAINEKGKTNSFDPICRADDTIKPVLELWIGNANVGKNFAIRTVSLLPNCLRESIYLR